MRGRIEKGRGTFDAQRSIPGLKSFGECFSSFEFQTARLFEAAVGSMTRPKNLLCPACRVEAQRKREPAAAGHGAGTRFGFFPRARCRRPAAIGPRAALNPILL